MNTRLIFVGAILIVAFAGCSVLFPRGERDGFIKVEGIHLVHNDKRYYFVGTNFWYGCYIGSPGETGDRPRLLLELDSLSANGLTNLRVLAASEASYLRKSLRPAIEPAPGQFNDTLLQGLDYLLAEMAERRMHAVLFLNNYWEWSGGMSQYNVWANGGGGVDPEDPAQGYGAFMNFSATFYKNEKANTIFRDHIKKIVTRRNTCNGRLYSEDPTIMAWQLANEPRPGTGDREGVQTLDALCSWIDQTAAYIHALDTNHLVSTGSEGTVSFRWSTEYFLKSHGSPHVDYLTFHLWPKNWEWFDPMNIPGTMSSAEEKSRTYVNQHLEAARQLKKPIVLEEFGLARDNARCAPGTPTVARDRFYATILAALYDSARAGSPAAGSNFWGWGGHWKGENADSVWRPGDPFVCDPPHEAQGFNSVFVTDTSTIHILREYAFKMTQLTAADSAYARGAP